MQQLPAGRRSLAIALALVAVAGGCATDGADIAAGPRTVSLAEFASPDPGERGEAPNQGEDTDRGSMPDDIVPARTTVVAPPRLGAASPDFDEDLLARLEQPEPDRRSMSIRLPGDRVIVDSLIGQINGRPVFADDILLPVEDQLVALSQRVNTTEEFMAEATGIVGVRLMDVVQSELILSEAVTSLTDEQQQGLLFYIRNMREEEVARRSGNRQEAERQLLEEEGKTLDEYLDLQKDQALIYDILRRKIRSRIVVSWHDIKREYERHFDEFNPPASVSLSLIRLTNDQAALIDEVHGRLTAGEDFADVAEFAGMRDRGRWQVFNVGPGGLTDIPINDAYKPYLEGLGPGQTTKAIDLNGRTMWFHIAEVTRPEGRSLYDPEVQQMLDARIRQQRMAQEQSRYLLTLVRRSATQDDMDQMLDRLLAIAMLRYSP